MTRFNPTRAAQAPSTLDRAIAASIAAMAAMSLFVMAQQLHAAPEFGPANAPTAQQA